jgi:hypothetical protein
MAAIALAEGPFMEEASIAKKLLFQRNWRIRDDLKRGFRFFVPDEAFLCPPVDNHNFGCHGKCSGAGDGA